MLLNLPFFNLRRLPKLLLYSLILAAFIFLVNLGIVLFSHEVLVKVMLLQLLSPLWDLLAASALFYAAKRSTLHSRRLALAWGLLATARLVMFIGETTIIILTVRLGTTPFPSLADLFFLAFSPLFLSGVLLLPTQRLKPLEWLKTGLDMSIVLFASVLVLWNYWLGPLAETIRDQRTLVQVLSLAYPVGNLVLLGALLMLLYRQPKGQKPSPLLLLALGMMIQIVLACLYGRQSILGISLSNDWLSLGWILTNLIFILVGVWQATRVQAALTTPADQATNSSVQPRLNTGVTYLPYGGLVAVFLLLIWSHFAPLSMSFAWMAVGVGSIIGLVLLRQMITLHENSLLFAQGRQQAFALHQTNQALQVEIAERKRAEAQLSHDALHDALTGLPNRVLFVDRLRHAIEFAKRHEGYRFATLFLDVDRFKVVNDSLGHAIGDQLLIGIAQRLRLCLRTGDTVARLSGDEFVMLLEDTKTEQDATTTAQRIQAQLQQPFNLAGHQLFASASVGIVPASQGYDQPEDVLRDADIAMYQAKTHGKARQEVFNLTMREQAETRLELENDLRYALERHELELHYQPILALQADRITGIEALLRWHHPQRGLIAPLAFIPIAEETGLIVPIGQWVLREACQQLRAWQVRFPQTPPLTMSVNVSGTQFAQPDFIHQVQAILREVGLDPTTLRLELTESVWLNSSPEAVALFRQLSHMGIQLHMDDFGTGYSSLAYLQHFPIRMLKIDRTFLNKMDDDNKNKEIVRAVIAMAHDLGMETVAEGIETVEQLDNLKQLGCNYGQGYLISRPVNQAAIEQWLTEQRLKPASPPQSLPSFKLADRALLAQNSIASAAVAAVL